MLDVLLLVYYNDIPWVLFKRRVFRDDNRSLIVILVFDMDNCVKYS